MALPVRRLNVRPNSNVEKRDQRSTRNVRFFQAEAKGHTHEFSPMLKSFTEVREDRTAALKVDLPSNASPDPFNYTLTSFLPVAGLAPIEPTYSFDNLAGLVTRNNTLRQCIESYVTNTETFGHALEYIGPEGEEDNTPAQSEKIKLEAFLSACSAELSLREIRERSRWDMETVGVRFFEIGRDMTGRISMMDHLPALTMRRTRKESLKVPVEVEVVNPADPTKMIRKTAYRNFCRFVQTIYGPMGYERIFFKEFGDPRKISPKNGEVDPSLTIEEEATEVLMLQLYTPGMIYGLPRWFGQLPSILGSRESEIVNLNFFRENAIPAMAVLISGGALTKESFQVIEDYINAMRGQKAMQRILVLEASGDDTMGGTDSSVSAPKIDMKPMISERQQDGLFQAYDKANQVKIRSSFRLPPIYAGLAEDYTRASAQASMVTAEQQVFSPERGAFDDVMNNKILRTYAPRFWRFKSNGAVLSDPDSLSKVITTLDAAGALTPNAVIKIANKVLDIAIKPVTEDWGDFPFQAVLQCVTQGRPVPGLTEFIVDLKAEAQQQKDEQQAALDLAAAAPPTPSPSGKLKIKPKPKSSQKSATDLNVVTLRPIIRREIGLIADDLADALAERIQVAA